MLIGSSLLAPLRSGSGFRALFLGLVVSRTGDAFSVVAITLITLSVAGPEQLGVLLLVGSLPLIVASPMAGKIVDLFGVRTPVAVDNWLRAGLSGVLALIAFADEMRIEYLYCFALLQSTIGAISEIGFEVSVPELVEDDDLESAHTLLSVVWDVAAVVGPVTAGLVVGWLGAGPALLFDAATFAVVALLARQLPCAAHTSVPASEAQERSVDRWDAIGASLRSNMRGFTILWHNRPIRVLALGSLFVLMTTGALAVVLAVLITEELGLSETSYGLLVSVAGLASLLGTTLLTPVFRRWRTSRALAIALAARGIFLAPLSVARGLPTATASASFSTAFDGPFYPLSRAQSQRLIPKRDLAAVTGARSSLGAAGYPLGSAIAGFAVASFGTSPVILAIALAHLPVIRLMLATDGIDIRPQLTEEQAVIEGEAA